MQFTYSITVPANTESTDSERLVTRLSYGILKQVSVYFPWGCAGLVGVRILHYEHQLYPTNPDEWFIGNEIYIVFADDYLIDQGSGDFKVEAYNEDDFYDHTPIVSFNIVVPTIAGPPELSWIEG